MANGNPDQIEQILPRDGEVLYYRQFFSPAESARYLESLQREIAWRHEAIQMFGRSVLQPRLTAWYGDLDKTYRYSGRTMHPLDWTPSLLSIRKKLELVSSARFTNVLLNLYRDGRDSMGWHQDDEPELGPEPVIGSVSFGQPRIFQLRHKLEKDLRVEVELENGSYLEMRGQSQKFWQHALPKRVRAGGARINLTFRHLIRSAKG